MKIEAAGETSVLVVVSAAELSGFGLTYESLDYANETTRQMIRILLCEIRRQTGQQLYQDHGQLQIDVLPEPGGGCLLVFTRRCLPAKSSVADAVFFGTDITPFLDASRAAALLDDESDSALYLGPQGLFLLIAGCSDALRRLLCEFLTPLQPSPIQASRVAETARCLLETRALEVLRSSGA